MNSTAFSLLASSNPEVNENQEMELTIGSLSFYVGPSGQLAFQIQRNRVRQQAKLT
jgi:hypothetical protein